MRIQPKTTGGFTLIEVMVTVAILGLLAGISVPNVMKSRDQAALKTILSNLRLVEEAKEVWALQAHATTGALPGEADLADYIRGDSLPTPVMGEVYNINEIGVPASATLAVKLGNIPAGGTVSLD
jgi:prepilin-type N-terminal cleavage/methylation domain-containing protein